MLGEVAALSASAVWACASIIFARLGRDVAPISLNFLKGTIALFLMVITAFLLLGPGVPSISAMTWVLLGASGIVGITLGDTSYFNALIKLGPRRTLLMSALVPPITATLGWLFLNEELTLVMVAGMCLTLAGVTWVIRERTGDDPDRDIMRAGILFALGAVLCQAAGNILTKAGSAEITALEISIIRLVFGTVGLGVVVMSLGKLRNTFAILKNAKTRNAIFVATILGTYLGIWLLNAGLKYTPNTGVAATLSSTSPLFILPLAALFDGERLTPRAVIGAAIAVAGVGILFSD